MQKNRIIRLIVMLVATCVIAPSPKAQPSPTVRPQLVVGIVIDQLDGETLELLLPQMSNGGFKRLMQIGLVIEDADYGREQTDAVAGTAMLMTGAEPRINGIARGTYFDREKLVESLTLSDTRYMGNFTSESYSPAAIRVSTLADEVRILNNGMGRVCAVAADAQTSVVLGGHAANSTFWISDSDGKWAGSTYYKETPQCVQNRNYRSPLSSRLDTMSWEPLLPIAAYTEVPKGGKFYGFKHSFGKNDPNRYRAFKQSALSNREVTDVALELLSSQNLGRRGELDMLCVGLSASAYKQATGEEDTRAELHDKYLRLDRDLERLLNAIDKSVGAGKAVIFVASDGSHTSGEAPAASFGIPSGEFRADRATSLLNMYLIAIHGNGNWVLGCYNREVFLNHKLIKERNVNLSEIRKESADFLRKMSGVMAAYTIDEIISNPVNEDLQSLYSATLAEYAGDVTVRVMPGWTVSETGRDAREQKTYVRSVSATSPVFIMAPGLSHSKVTGRTDVRRIAPTISRLLRIATPNASQGASLK